MAIFCQNNKMKYLMLHATTVQLLFSAGKKSLINIEHQTHHIYIYIYIYIYISRASSYYSSQNKDTFIIGLNLSYRVWIYCKPFKLMIRKGSRMQRKLHFVPSTTASSSSSSVDSASFKSTAQSYTYQMILKKNSTLRTTTITFNRIVHKQKFWQTHKYGIMQYTEIRD